MRVLSVALAGLMLVAASGAAAQAPVEKQALLHQLANDIQPERMRADIEAGPAGSFVSVGDPAPRAP